MLLKVTSTNFIEMLNEIVDIKDAALFTQEENNIFILSEAKRPIIYFDNNFLFNLYTFVCDALLMVTTFMTKNRQLTEVVFCGR